MTRHATTTRAAKFCDGCGHEVVFSEGNYLTTGDQAEHVDCLKAAELRGRRRGYADAVRQMRDATRALKGAR